MIKCPHCGSLFHGVVDEEEVKDRPQILRKEYRCGVCRATFQTTEIAMASYPISHAPTIGDKYRVALAILGSLEGNCPPGLEEGGPECHQKHSQCWDRHITNVCKEAQGD